MNKVTLSAKAHLIYQVFLVLFILFNPISIGLIVLGLLAIDPAATWHIAMYFANHFCQFCLLGLGLVVSVLLFKFLELLESL